MIKISIKNHILVFIIIKKKKFISQIGMNKSYNINYFPCSDHKDDLLNMLCLEN